MRAAVDVLADGGIEALTTRQVATTAGTSPAAIAELFGGKPGLLSAVALEGFAELHRNLSAVRPSGDPVDDLTALGEAFRRFATARPSLVSLMTSQPHGRFEPDPGDVEIARQLHALFSERFGVLLGGRGQVADDIAVGFVALLQGLAGQERTGLLGTSATSRNRRWRRAVGTFLAGAAAGADRAV